MTRIKCHECGGSYDYDEDSFCARCGAFNQPPKERHGLEEDALRQFDPEFDAHPTKHAGFRGELEKAFGVSRDGNEEQGGDSSPGDSVGDLWASVDVKRFVSEAKTFTGEHKSGMNVVKWILLAVIGWNVLMSVLGLFFSVLSSIF